MPSYHPIFRYDAEAGGMVMAEEGEAFPAESGESGAGGGHMGQRSLLSAGGGSVRPGSRSLLYANVTAYTTTTTMTVVDCQGNPTAMYARWAAILPSTPPAIHMHLLPSTPLSHFNNKLKGCSISPVTVEATFWF